MRYIFLFLIAAGTLFSAGSKVINYFQGTQIKQITGLKNEIWFGTYGKGLIVFDKKTEKWKTINSGNSGLKNDLIECFAVDDANIWVGGTDGLWICDREKNNWTKKTFSSGGIYGQWVRSLFYDPVLSNLWVGRFAGLTLYNKTTKLWQDFDLIRNKDGQTNNFKALYVDSDLILWAGAEAGLYKINTLNLDRNNFEYISTKTEGFSNNSTYASVSCIKEFNKTIYVGLAEFITPEKPNYNIGGLFILERNKKWKGVTKRTGLISNGVYSLDIFGNYVVLGTYEFIPTSKNEKGMNISFIDRTNHKVTNIKFKSSGIVNEKVFSMYYDGKNLWLGTYSGISRVYFDNSFLNLIK